MDQEAYRIARRIEDLGRKAFLSVFDASQKTISEHHASGVCAPTGPDGSAYLACLFLAASVDRGNQPNIPLITHNQGGPHGIAGGPRSVVYWLTFNASAARFADPEATALILEAWAFRRQKSPLANRKPRVKGFSETPRGDPLLQAPADPILEIEQAIRMPGTLELPLPELTQLPEHAYAHVLSATCLPPDSWARHPALVEQAIAAWGKVAPVVPLRVSRDARTRAGWKFLERLIEHVDSAPRPESILSFIASDAVTRREIRRIAADSGLYRRGWVTFHPRIVDLERRLAAIGV
jgi:hypothetical protein